MGQKGETFPAPYLYQLFFFFKVVLGFERRTSCLWDRCSLTWPTHPTLNFLKMDFIPYSYPATFIEVCNPHVHASVSLKCLLSVLGCSIWGPGFPAICDWVDLWGISMFIYEHLHKELMTPKSVTVCASYMWPQMVRSRVENLCPCKVGSQFSDAISSVEKRHWSFLLYISFIIWSPSLWWLMTPSYNYTQLVFASLRQSESSVSKG
jgi:hypothetical protein